MSFDPINEPLGQLVFERTYSRTKEDGTQESWEECVERVVDGNLSLVSNKFIEPNERERLIYLIMRKILLPAGRHLWASGTGSYALSNCFRAGFDKGFASHCAFMFNQLMLGGGVGANYSSSYFEEMPEFLSRVVVRACCSSEHPDHDEMKEAGLLGFEERGDPHPTIYVVVEDSREGWVEALEELILTSIHSVPVTIMYDVSNVRGKGSPIVGFGGVAAGPAPLIRMLQQVAGLIQNQRGFKPTPLFAMTVDHAIADCVVAGNVRRSARMSMLHWQDPYIFEFIHCKEDHLNHWSTNISVEVDDDFFAALEKGNAHAEKVLDEVVRGMLRNGEPGFYNSSLASVGEHGDVRCTNPCGEIPLEDWESCILGHVNLARGTTEERFEAFRLMARFLVRTSCAPIQDSKQRNVVRRNRRIGVGFFGLQEYMAKRGFSYLLPNEIDANRLRFDLATWSYTVRKAADKYADEMGIPRPIKTTTVAPTGTVAKLAGTTEGIQPIYARHFIRRVRFADNDSNIPTQYPNESCLYTQNTTVVSIPCEDPVVSRVSNPAVLVDASELPVEAALRLQELIQNDYADNSISHTINVPEGKLEPGELKNYLVDYLPRLKGVTVMVDQTRPQSPYERISEDEFQLLSATGFEATQSEEDQCVGACPIK